MPRWYVIQVGAGRDDIVLERVRRRAAELAEAGEVAPQALARVFSPRYETQAKVKGEYRLVRRRLTPGYLVAASSRPQDLERVCRTAGEFARLLRNEEGFTPLSDDEAAWMAAFTKEGRRAVPMSTAVKEGDEVVVTEGPLLGCAFPVKRIDRHRSTAWLEVTICGRAKEVPVGLRVVARRDGDRRSDS
ncbi:MULTISPECIES: transcription termination/antitermination protein NusG [unclassified Adlercreutzia]|uniref:transcription termination/antitermination protein NusG n=1 Tax=unclassified Adlercreutzia TaxID=2636013 RepID=UPI0013EB44F6|nr:MULTISPECIES: transcription termination/antitermination NusG family protein [unclassified Adlercreutzia]